MTPIPRPRTPCARRFDPSDAADGRTHPLQREQFETLAERIVEATDGFDLRRLPPNAEPHATVLTLHPRYEINLRAETITETDEATSTTSQLVDGEGEGEPSAGAAAPRDEQERAEPELPLYSDALLLIDALERHDPAALDEIETPALINLYTLLSDVQRNASDLRH